MLTFKELLDLNQNGLEENQDPLRWFYDPITERTFLLVTDTFNKFQVDSKAGKNSDNLPYPIQNIVDKIEYISPLRVIHFVDVKDPTLIKVYTQIALMDEYNRKQLYTMLVHRLGANHKLVFHRKHEPDPFTSGMWYKWHILARAIPRIQRQSVEAYKVSQALKKVNPDVDLTFETKQPPIIQPDFGAHNYRLLTTFVKDHPDLFKKWFGEILLKELHISWQTPEGAMNMILYADWGDAIDICIKDGLDNNTINKVCTVKEIRKRTFSWILHDFKQWLTAQNILQNKGNGLDLTFENSEESTSKTDITGVVRWYDNNKKYHKVGGPAIAYPDGSEVWYNHGLLHRIDGPALKSKDTTQWWVNGKRMSEDAFNEWRKLQSILKNKKHGLDLTFEKYHKSMFTEASTPYEREIVPGVWKITKHSTLPKEIKLGSAKDRVYKFYSFSDDVYYYLVFEEGFSSLYIVLYVPSLPNNRQYRQHSSRNNITRNWPHGLQPPDIGFIKPYIEEFGAHSFDEYIQRFKAKEILQKASDKSGIDLTFEHFHKLVK